MQHDFWHQKWAKNEIGFHLPNANPLLVTFFSALTLKANARVFLPLCGKTFDIAWLLNAGYQVVGVELSQTAIDDLFKQLHLTPVITQQDQMLHYSAKNIDIFVGDIFRLTPALVGKIDAVYDRAALVALPESMRHQYSKHLCVLSHHAPQLLICFEYDQTIHAGPPFSISPESVLLHYGATHSIHCLASHAMPNGLKGQFPATEAVWHLVPLT